MKTYITRRLLQAILVLFILSVAIFVVMRLLPGDPILMLITGDELSHTSEERIQSLRKEFGLDRPLIFQYISWVADLLKGELGISIVHREKVQDEIKRRLPITVHLGVSAFALGIILGIPLGIISAVRRGTWWDSVVTFLANLGITAPPFWLGVLLIYFLGLYLKLLPIFGYTSPFENFWLSLKQAIMPVVCLSVYPIAATARQTRSSMLEVIPQDYIRTAWSKGLTEKLVIARHALKNALIPVATLQGIILRFVLGGSVIVETVFNIPGIGRLAVEAMVAQDYPVVQGVILVVGTITIIINLLVDLLYGFLDPRIRYE